MYFPRDDLRNNGEVRTLFLSGLPEDVKEREIHNLFRLVPGYESCKLATAGNRGPVAFVSFSDRSSALLGQSYFQGIKFDPEQMTTLRIEFAKANSKIKRVVDENPFAPVKRFRTSSPYPSPHPPPLGYSMAPVSPIPRGSMLADVGRRSPPEEDGRRPPCNTLFVANLDPQVSKTELAHLFGALPGYKRLRMPLKEGRGRANAFVEFADMQLATNALYTLQGYLMSSTPLHIDYAKTPMGEQGHRGREQAARLEEEKKDRGVEDGDDE